MSKTSSERVIAGKKTITNAMTIPEIAKILTNFNFTADRMTTGLGLCTEAEELINIQKKEFGERLDATERLNKAFTQANDEYVKILKIARIVFRDNLEAQSALVLNGIRKQTLNGWFTQAKPFYGNLLSNDNYLKAMSDYAYTPEKIKVGANLLAECENFSNIQQKELSEASEAVKLRDEKIDQLDTWLSDFKTVCKVAFGKDSAHFETLGFK